MPFDPSLIEEVTEPKQGFNPALIQEVPLTQDELIAQAERETAGDPEIPFAEPEGRFKRLAKAAPGAALDYLKGIALSAEGPVAGMDVGIRRAIGERFPMYRKLDELPGKLLGAGVQKLSLTPQTVANAWDVISNIPIPPEFGNLPPGEELPSAQEVTERLAEPERVPTPGEKAIAGAQQAAVGIGGGVLATRFAPGGLNRYLLPYYGAEALRAIPEQVREFVEGYRTGDPEKMARGGAGAVASGAFGAGAIKGLAAKPPKLFSAAEVQNMATAEAARLDEAAYGNWVVTRSGKPVRNPERARTLTPEERETRQFLEDNKNNPRALAERFGVQLGRTEYASKDQETAKIYGDLRTRAEQGVREVPVQEGGAGVLPQAPQKSPAQLGVLRLAEAAAKRLGFNVEAVEDLGPNRIAKPKSDEKTIRISPRELQKYVEGTTPQKARQLVDDLINHEEIHYETPNEIAEAYRDNATELQRKIFTRIYGGRGAGVDIFGKTPESQRRNLGKEMLRFHLQRLLGMTSTEILSATRKEWLTVRGLDLMDRFINTARQVAMRKARTRQIEILNEMQRKVSLARQALMTRKEEEPREQKAQTLAAPAQAEPAATQTALPIVEPGPAPMSRVDLSVRRLADRGWSQEQIDALGEEEIVAAAREGRNPPSLALNLPPFLEGGEPFAINKTAAEALRNKPGETDYRTIALMPASELSKLWEGMQAKKLGVQRDAPLQGLKLRSEDVPMLERLRDEAQKRSSEALARGDFATQAAEFGRNIWFSGAIEGARRWGPNLHSVDPSYPESEPVEQPAARRKPKEGPGQEAMMLPPAKPGEERPTAEQAAQRIPVTPAQVEATATAHLDEAKRPSFNAFAADVGEQHGPVQPGQLREAWTDAVWKRLMSASGKELGRYRDSLGLQEAIGKQDIPDAPAEEVRAKPTGEVQPEFGEAFYAQPGIERQPEAVQAGVQERRANAIARIGEKLLKEAQEVRPTLKKTSLTPEDIGWWREVEGTQAFTEFSPGEAVTGEALTQGGAAHRTGRKALPESATKRITALLDTSTGKIELVSTYRTGRGKVYIVAPANPGKTAPHVPMNDLLGRALRGQQRYRPIASFLTDEPVQGFHQRMTKEQWQEFADRANNEAQRRAESRAEAPAMPEEGAEEARPALGGAGPMTDAEAGAILDHLYDEVGRIDSPSDMKDALTALQERATMGELKGRDWQVITGLEKAARTIAEENPNLTPEEVYERTLDQIYTDAIGSPNREAFVQRMLGRTAPDIAQGVLQPKAPTGRELTMLSRRAPTAVAGEVLPEGAPEPKLPAPEAPKVLSPEEQAAVAKGAAQRFPVTRKQWAKLPAETGLQVMVEEGPAAYRKPDEVGAMFTKTARGVRALFRRGTTNVNIGAHLDSFDNTGNNTARQKGNSIRVRSKDPRNKGSMERQAAVRVVEAGFDRNNLVPMRTNVDVAITKATDLARNGKGFMERYEGRRWLAAAQRIKESLDYAAANWGDATLQATAKRAREVLDEVYEFDKNRGVTLDYRTDYVPGRYEGEVFNDNVLQFGNQQLILGRNWRKAKAFLNYAEAIREGYIPANSDVADLVEHRVRQSWREGGKEVWLESLKSWNDPDSGEPIVSNLVRKEIPMGMRTEVDPETGQVSVVPRNPNIEFSVPSEEYVKFSLGPGKQAVAVRRGYKDLLDVLTMEGHIGKHPIGAAALHINAFLKHGVILILDTFHPGRLFQYSLGIGAPTWRKGLSVLEWSAADAQAAADKGLISQKSVNWANEFVDVRLPGGRTGTMTNRQIYEAAQKQGLNAGRIADALYNETVRNWPVIGALNRFTFERLTRGLMVERSVSEFKRLNEAYPALDREKVMRKVVHDINMTFGSLGRQGFFRNPTIREINQLAFLAPQWVEGLLQKEVRAGSRLAVSGPWNVVRNKFVEDAEKRIPFGTIGRGMARGLAGYFVLTQVINYITRGHSTFQNPEDDHKIDAWIPGWGGSPGFFLSPLSVFAEVTHDIVRYAEQKPKLADAFNQIGHNKLGVLGRAAMVIGTQRNAQGEILTSTPSIYGEAVKQVIPYVGASPISVSKLAREAGHAVAPETIAPNPPGVVQRQLMSSAGVKTEAAPTDVQQIYAKARRFMAEQKIRPKGYELVPTEDPSYAKVRVLLRRGDEKGAIKMLNTIRGPDPSPKTDKQVKEAMKAAMTRPITGSKEHERKFKDSLTDAELDLYYRARDAQKAEYQKFQDVWDRMR